MDYSIKYFKYKKKYLQLKKMQLGGKNKCINNCGRFVHGNFTTCCQACISAAGPHTLQCDQRNPKTIYHTFETISLINPTSTRKSADINTSSLLFNILSSIQTQISLLPNYQPPRMGLHVELVDNVSDTINKNNNYNSINNKQIDLCAKTNWYCEGGAFSLLIGFYPGHKNPLHITVGYFGNYANCQNILILAQNIVSNILGKQLH